VPIFKKIVSSPSNDPLVDFESADPTFDEGHLRARRRRRLGRVAGVLVAMGMFWGLVWLVGFSSVTEPLRAQAGPAVVFVKDVIDNPAKAWTAVAVLLVSHIGILTFIFDDRNY